MHFLQLPWDALHFDLLTEVYLAVLLLKKTTVEICLLGSIYVFLGYFGLDEPAVYLETDPRNIDTDINELVLREKFTSDRNTGNDLFTFLGHFLINGQDHSFTRLFFIPEFALP